MRASTLSPIRRLFTEYAFRSTCIHLHPLVDEDAAKKVDIIKICLDDRDHTVTKLSPGLYGAAIDEAHKHHFRTIMYRRIASEMRKRPLLLGFRRYLSA